MDIPDPFAFEMDEFEAEGQTIAERVSLGKATNNHGGGAIVPFHPIVDQRGIMAALSGKEKAAVQRQMAAGFQVTPYFYRSEQGEILQAVLRFDHAHHAKSIKPLIHCGKGVYWFHSIEGQRPLYNLDQLFARPEAPVLVVEGEKAAEAAQAIFPEYVVTTWMSGASSVYRAEMLPLAGRRVTIWPDNDEAGRKAANAFAAHALKAGATSASIVTVPDIYPEKWDLADPLPAEVGSNATLSALLGDAKEVSLSDVEQHSVDAEHKAKRFRLLGYKPGYSRVSHEAVSDALAMLDPDMKRHQWLNIARCLYFAFGSAGLEMFDHWSKGGDKYKDGEPQALWDSFEQSQFFSAAPLIWLLRKAQKQADADRKNFVPNTSAVALAEIERLNENNAVVTRAGKTVVLHETYDPTFARYAISYLSKDEFAKKHIRHIELPEGDDQRPLKGRSTRPLGAYWFGSNWRRQYDNVYFAPGQTLGRRNLNLWSGFAVDPVHKPDGWDKLKYHLFHHVAGGDQQSFDYILNWLAFGVQTLHTRLGTALVFVGPKGAGKSIIIAMYGRLFGQHAFVTSHDSDITGRFNARLETTLLLGIEEAFAPQDRKADGVLKDLITRTDLRLEDKFFSVWTARNHLRIIMTSNNDHVVRADLSERRYAVFEVNTPHQNDPSARRQYFGAIIDQMENGGYEAMLGELLIRNIDGWNPEAIPETPALRDQKIANLINDPVVAWYHERLCDGIDITSGLANPQAHRHQWGQEEMVHVPVREVLEDIAAFAKAKGMNFSEHKVRGKLEAFMPPGFKSSTQWRYDLATHQRTDSFKAYPFPSIAEARHLFREATGIEISD